MQKKAARPLFNQAISAVRKQVDSGQYNKKKTQNENQQSKQDNHLDDMSSGEQQRLKQLGVDLNKKKKIVKQSSTHRKQDPESGTWKHDKYTQNRQKQHKPKFQPYPKKTQSLIIRFPTLQQYNKIYQLVKSQKAFIEEINEHCIKFSKEYAFNTCKRILKTEGIQFVDQNQKDQASNGKNSKDEKESIFNRLK